MTLFRTLALALAFANSPLLAQTAGSEAAIRHVLDRQVEAWNRADISAFMQGYAENCIFVGKPILHGKSQLEARYQKLYPSPDAMGKLSFQNLAIHQLDHAVAIVTGNWNLDRPASSGGIVGGVFSLVFQREKGNWRIILDHTS